MSARTDLADVLTTSVPAKWNVISHGPAADTTIGAGRALVAVVRSSVEPSSIHNGYDNRIDVWLLTGATSADKVEDELDDLLPTLVGLLEAQELPLGTIERGIYAQLFHGYKIPVTCYTPTV